MPHVLQWTPDPEDTTRQILQGTNNTIGEATEITIFVPQANRSFYFPGPLAINASHLYWNPLPGLSTGYSISQMSVTYTVLGLTITEPVL